MKYILGPFIILFVFAGNAVFAQKDTTTFYLDTTLTLVAKAKATCVEKIYQQGQLWHTSISYIYKPYRIMTGSYSDKTLSTAEGLFTYFLRDTMIMQGNYHDGQQDGIWKKWTTGGLITDSVYFNGGRVIGQAKYQYHVNNHLWRYSLETSDQEKITNIYDTADVLISQGRFKDRDGEMFLYYPNGKTKSHSIYKNNQRIIYELFDENGNKQ